MGTRKRAGKGGGDKPDTDEKPAKRKATPPGASKSDRQFYRSLFLVILIASGAVITHYYVGFDYVLDVVNRNVDLASLLEDEALEQDAAAEVPMGEGDTAERVRRTAEEEQHHSQELYDPPPRDDGDQLLPSETPPDKTEDFRETNEHEKEGDRLDDLDEEPVEEEEMEPEGERFDELDDQVLGERGEMEPEGDTIEEFSDQSEGETIEQFNDQPEEDTIEEFNDELEADTIEQFNDRPEGDTIEQFNNQLEGETIEQFNDQPEGDIIEQFSDQPEGDSDKEFNDQILEEKSPEKIVQDNIIFQEKIGDTFDDLDVDKPTEDDGTFQEKVGDSFEDLDVDQPDQVHSEEEPETQREDDVTDEDTMPQDGVIEEAAKDELFPERQEEVVELTDFQDTPREHEVHETQEEGDDVLLDDAEEEPNQKSDEMIEPVDIQAGPDRAELPEVDDVREDLLKDDDKHAEEEETTDSILEETHYTAERRKDDIAKDEESDDDYETAPENEVYEETSEEEKEVNVEPIQLEIHHKDVMTESEDDDRDNLMMEAVQEPNINIQVKVHKVEEIRPEVKIDDEPEVVELEPDEKETHDQRKQVEDDFSEFDREIEEEREDFIHTPDEELRREKEEERKSEDEEIVDKEEESNPEQKEVLEEALNQEQSEERKEDENIDVERQEHEEDAADEENDEEISKDDKPELPPENVDQKEEEQEEITNEEEEDLIQGGESGKQTTDRAAKDAEDEPPKEEVTKPHYRHADITNSEDNKIRGELDWANDINDVGKGEEGLKLFEGILKRYPKSPRAQFGKAHALDVMSEKKQSNQLLEQSIAEYEKVLSMENVPPALFLKTGRRLADRQQFRGWGSKSLKTRRLLLDKFPEELSLWNEFGVGALTIGRVEDARQAFQGVLDRSPDDGFAMVHMGFIIKTTDANYEKAVPLLKRGIETDSPGVIDGRFFFHLGDAQYRMGNSTAAYETYELGAKKGLFRSMYQRSLYNVDHLSPKPWWKPEETGNEDMLKMLAENWQIIRDEGLAQLDASGAFRPEEENLRESGDWKQFTLYQQGRKFQKNCDKTPKTCGLLEQFRDAVECRRGQIKYSVMHPGIHVWPHCGPTNCRIRAHLGLVVPEGPKIRVATEYRNWTEGKFIIFDDSFEHEVWWTEGVQTGFRLVLIVDMWHPELTEKEKRTLTAI